MITRFEKRVIAGMLAIMMCFSMVQFPVMAAEEQEVKTEESTVVENIVQEEAEETENVVEKEVESVNEKESTETQQEMITEVVSEEAGDIEEKEVSEIVLNDKYNADIEVMGKYKFTPKESGKYVFLASNYLYVNIRDDKEQYIGRFYNNNRIALVAGQTYYIEIETIKNQEWSLTKATEVELQLNTKYELTADQAVNYRFIPAQSNTYLFNLDNPGTITVYDSEWKSVAYGAKASLMAGEIYYIVVIPKEEILTWEVDKCEVSGEYSYKIQDNGTIGIMGYLGKQGIISIPESIDGKEVTVICAGAFNRNNIISEVSIPSNVKEIAGSAFSNCPNLRQVKFACKSKLENIGNGAFYFSEQLSNFIIPNGVKKLGDQAFDFTALTEIEIPDSVTEVGYSLFANCNSLQKVSIGSGLKKLSCSMFWDCTKLEQINFLKSGISNVTRIEYDAFGYCSNLKDIKFPDSVKSMGANSMSDTGWYNNQNDGVLYLNQILYGYKGEMSENTEMVVKDGTTVITDRAFKGQKGIKNVQLPETVTNIGKFSFYDCTQMKSVTIPKNVTEIGKYALGYIEGTENEGKLVSEEWFSTYVKKMDNFTIKGYSGTAAEKYAKENGFEFVSLGTVEPEIKFVDIAKTDWFYDAAMYVAENKIMTGLTADTFGPEATLTRAQFATILYRLNGEPAIEYSKKFSDIADGQWYTKGVLWANSIGVVTGYNGGLFGPDDNITREQMALMMHRYAKYKEYDISKTADISSFEDANKVNSYAEDAFKWAVGSDVISGKSGNKLDPQGKATRAECAAIMMRFMEKYKK